MTEAGQNGDDVYPGEEGMDMASLLEAEEVKLHSLRRGEVIEGTIVGRDRDGVIVNVGAKSEGVIYPNEMQSLGHNPSSKLNEGDRVLVYIVQPETQEGQVLLSIDRARGETGWRDLQARFESQENFEVEIIGQNKGGLLCNVEGVNAFIPLSQLANVRSDPDNPDGIVDAVGKTMRVKVIELNRRRNRVILSERAAAQEYRSQQKDKLLIELQEGQIRKGRVTSIRDFGVFIDLGGADGLAHLSELSWDRDKSPSDLYKIGEEVDAYVMKVDSETKKIALSLRRAQPQKWDGLVDRYALGEVVVGRVTKLVPFGAFAQIEGQLEGLIHVSEIAERKISHPNEVLTEGDLLPLKIVRIERDRHRLALSLKQARNEGEIRGFEFNNNGSVVSVPEGEQAKLVREGITAPPWQRGQAGEAAPTAVAGGVEVAADADASDLSAGLETDTSTDGGDGTMPPAPDEVAGDASAPAAESTDSQPVAGEVVTAAEAEPGSADAVSAAVESAEPTSSATEVVGADEPEAVGDDSAPAAERTDSEPVAGEVVTAAEAEPASPDAASAEAVSAVESAESTPGATEVVAAAAPEAVGDDTAPAADNLEAPPVVTEAAAAEPEPARAEA